MSPGEGVGSQKMGRGALKDSRREIGRNCGWTPRWNRFFFEAKPCLIMQLVRIQDAPSVLAFRSLDIQKAPVLRSFSASVQLDCFHPQKATQALESLRQS